MAKIGLLSNQNTYEQFNNFVTNLKDEEGNISENYTSLLLDFIGSARDDLEVQETMTIEQKKALEETKEESKKVAETYSKPYQQTFYSDFDHWIKELNILYKDKITNKQINLAKFFHDEIQIKCEVGRVKFSKTGGISMYAIDDSKSKFFAVEIYKNGNIGLLMARHFQEQYFRPHIENLNIVNIRRYDPYFDNHSEENLHPTFTRPWGYNLYEVQDKISLIEIHKDSLMKMAIMSYETAFSNKKLSVSEQNHKLLEPVFGNTYSFEKYI